VQRLQEVGTVRYLAHYRDFDQFFALLLSFKEVQGIHNTATALAKMCEIVEAWLEHQKDLNTDGPAQTHPARRRRGARGAA
jgi:hypothetical protein